MLRHDGEASQAGTASNTRHHDLRMESIQYGIVQPVQWLQAQLDWGSWREADCIAVATCHRSRTAHWVQGRESDTLAHGVLCSTVHNNLRYLFVHRQSDKPHKFNSDRARCSRMASMRHIASKPLVLKRASGLCYTQY